VRLRQFVMLNPRCAEMERMSPGEPPKFLSRLVARRTKPEEFEKTLAKRNRAGGLSKGIMHASDCTAQEGGFLSCRSNSPATQNMPGMTGGNSDERQRQPAVADCYGR